MWSTKDDPWDVKRQTKQYNNTQFEMTRQLRGQYTDWKTDQIEERTENLAELAADIWSL